MQGCPMVFPTGLRQPRMGECGGGREADQPDSSVGVMAQMRLDLLRRICAEPGDHRRSHASSGADTSPSTLPDHDQRSLDTFTRIADPRN
jgi:hypothetical protein